MTSSNVGDGIDGGLRRREEAGAIVAEDQHVAAADRIR